MIDSTDPTWYAARDASSPGELAAIYGEPNVNWMPANTRHYQRMISGDQRFAQRFGWATYLENARIRELAQGEARPLCAVCAGPLDPSAYGGYVHLNDRDDTHVPVLAGDDRPCWHGATAATCAVDTHNGEATR